MRRRRLVGALVATPFLASAAAPAAAATFPGAAWQRATPASLGMDGAKLKGAIAWAQNAGTGSILVVRSGLAVGTAGDLAVRRELKSATKSVGSILLGLALMDSRVSLSGNAATYMPGFGTPPSGNAARAGAVTIQHLATHTAGFEADAGFGRLLYAPGSSWSYSNGGANWLADVLTTVYRRDLAALLRGRVSTKIGITSTDLTWRSNAYRPKTLPGTTIPRREFGSGISASVNAMARLGYLMLRGGNWNGVQILPTTYVDAARQTPSSLPDTSLVDPVEFPDADRHYGLLWWNNNDGSMAGVPHDAYWAWGKGESLILVVPSLDLVVARTGAAWQGSNWMARYGTVAPFFQKVVASVIESA